MTNRKLTVAGTQDLGPQLTQNPHQMIGQDGAYSFPLGNGKSFWFFGDTLMGARIPGDSLWFPGGVQIGPEDMGGRGSIERMVTNGTMAYRFSTDHRGARFGAPPFQLPQERGYEVQIVRHEVTDSPRGVLLWDARAEISFPDDRAIVVLRYYDDLSEAQIADALGCRPGTVKSQAAAALTTLRRTLGAFDLEPEETR